MLATPLRPLRLYLLTAALLIASPNVVGVSAEPTLRDVLESVHTGLEVRLARQSERGAEADVSTANHAPLPVLSGKVSQIDLQNGLGAGDLLGRKRIDKSIGLDWIYERGDKRTHRTRVAERTLAATQAETAETTLQQMLVAQAAYFDWLAARERVQLMRDSVELANVASRGANTRMRAGDLSAQDALRVEIDSQRVDADLQSAQLDMERAEIALAQVTSRADLTAARRAPVTWPTLPALAVPDGNAAAALETGRADVKAAQARLDAARSGLDSALALRKVDPTWGVSFDHYPGTSNRLIELRVQIPLTFGYNYQGEVGRAQSDLSQAELTADRVLRDARSERVRLAAEARVSRERAEKFGSDIVPRATTVLKQAEFAFARGAIPLTDVLDARLLRGPTPPKPKPLSFFAPALNSYCAKS
jgi:outer membrane protein, heavy metal efflux system